MLTNFATTLDAAHSAEFVARLQKHYEQMCDEQARIIYIDGSHFHQDLNLGYARAPVGKLAWRGSYLHLSQLASTELPELCDKKGKTQFLTEFGSSIQNVTASLPKRNWITSKDR